mmetsp:Transcript_13234/g.30162  ORF Transcript_13234/g.30162 Transcript_13234/m.30162 type:complete len:735 (+) Transcript_13234:70-2274(+)
MLLSLPQQGITAPSRPATSPATAGIDPFQKLLRQLNQEHQRLVKQKNQEIESLRSRLDAVLSATWKLSDSECRGSPTRASAKSLYLTTKAPMEQQVWKVGAEKLANKDIPKETTEGDGGTFNILSVWQVLHRTKKMKKRGSSQSLDSSCCADGADPVVGMSKTCLGRRVSTPYSVHRLLWDLAGLVLLAYDMVVIPLGAFNPTPNWFLIGMDWMSLVFWTADMAASFLTGYIDKDTGATMMNPRAIARRYLRTWFLLDLTIVGFDWTYSIMDIILDDTSAGESLNFGSLFRVLRVARVVRLLRLAKLRNALLVLKDRIESELVFVVLFVSQFVILLLFINHFLGSAWWLFGEVSKGSDSPSWITTNSLEEETLYYRYITALHWSLGHFSLGTMTMQPQNSGERSYAIVVLVFGMICFSAFTAILTNKMMSLRDSGSEQTTQLSLMRRYLRQNNVPNHLVFRILRYSEYAVEHQQCTIHEQSLAILALLSDGLRSELSYHIYFSCILKHPLLQEAHDMSELLIQGLVGTVLTRKSVARADVLFEDGMEATHMYYVISGSLTYSRPQDMRAIDVRPGDWLCEQALWVPWDHCGTAQATSECAVIHIDVPGLGEALCVDPSLWALVGKYASNFAKWLNTLVPDDLSDLFIEDEGVALTKRFIPSKEEQHQYLSKSNEVTKPKGPKEQGRVALPGEVPPHLSDCETSSEVSSISSEVEYKGAPPEMPSVVWTEASRGG